jgi:hypothetical protein
VTATAAPPRPRIRHRAGLLAVLAAAAAVILLALVMIALRGPARVDRVSVVNPTGAPVTVSASGGDGSRLLLGTVGGGSRFGFTEVLDQGDRWQFRLRVGPDAVGVVERTRDQLDRDDWTVTVPGSVIARLPADRR